MLGTTFGLATISVALLEGVRAASTPAANAIPALGFFNSSVNGGAWLTVTSMVFSFLHET